MKTFSEACAPFANFEALSGYAERFEPSIVEWVNAEETQHMALSCEALLLREMLSVEHPDFHTIIRKLFCVAFASGVAVGCEMERTEL